MSESSNCTFGPVPKAELNTKAKFNAFKQRSVESHSPLTCSGSVFVGMQLLTTHLIAPLRWLALAVVLVLGTSACSFKEETVGLSIVSYNHTTDRSITRLSVDGNMGIGTRPQSGGGGFSCCVHIPKVWHPGIKVKIAWGYQGGTELPPPPPDQEVEVDVPKYGPEDLSMFAVHFFPDHKVRVLVNNNDIDRPNYPPELRWDAPTPQ